VLPVAVLVIYNFGYYTRMTRASMAEVMTSQYVRTAVLKGLPRQRVVVRHALRNALIAPFTVMVLQLNYLLSGVIVVEVFFSYKGFGKLIYEAALFGDIYLISACTMVAVFVAVLSQFISDVGYTVLNPRIRFSEAGMTDIVAEQPAHPKRVSVLRRFGRSVALLRESPIGMVGAFLVTFWVFMAVFAPVLPIKPPLAQDASAMLTPWLHPDGRRHHVLAGHRRPRPRHPLAPHLGLQAGAVLVRAGDHRGLHRRHDARCHGGLPRRLVGRGDLVLRQRAVCRSR
jgi:hypothetical protein